MHIVNTTKIHTIVKQASHVTEKEFKIENTRTINIK